MRELHPIELHQCYLGCRETHSDSFPRKAPEEREWYCAVPGNKQDRFYWNLGWRLAWVPWYCFHGRLRGCIIQQSLPRASVFSAVPVAYDNFLELPMGDENKAWFISQRPVPCYVQILAREGQYFYVRSRRCIVIHFASILDLLWEALQHLLRPVNWVIWL